MNLLGTKYKQTQKRPILRRPEAKAAKAQNTIRGIVFESFRSKSYNSQQFSQIILTKIIQKTDDGGITIVLVLQLTIIGFPKRGVSRKFLELPLPKICEEIISQKLRYLPLRKFFQAFEAFEQLIMKLCLLLILWLEWVKTCKVNKFNKNVAYRVSISY